MGLISWAGRKIRKHRAEKRKAVLKQKSAATLAQEANARLQDLQKKVAGNSDEYQAAVFERDKEIATARELGYYSDIKVELEKLETEMYKVSDSKIGDKVDWAKNSLDALQERAKVCGSNQEEYYHILKEKNHIEGVLNRNKVEDKDVDDKLAGLKTKLDEIHASSKKAEQEEAIASIEEQRNTPLETLIGVVSLDNEGQKLRSKKYRKQKKNGQNGNSNPSTPQADSIRPGHEKNASLTSVWARTKEYFGERFEAKLLSLKNLKKLVAYGQEIGDTSNDIMGMEGDIGDISDLKDYNPNEKKMDGSATGIIGASLSGLSMVINATKALYHLVQDIRKGEHTTLVNEAGDEIEKKRQDAQNRWKKSRQYLHDIVDFVDGLGGTLAPVMKKVPVIGPIWSIVTAGGKVLLNGADIITNSVHIEMMRRDRNKIWDKMKLKRLKYEALGDVDAEYAYDIGNVNVFNRSDKVDEKRRALMESLGSEMLDATEKVASDELRSRNDSTNRELQYGLADRMDKLSQPVANPNVTKEEAAKTAKANRSKRRQLEAFEMMEEFRETDKSHKKMRGTLYHNLEDIIMNSLTIVQNGLQLAGIYGASLGIGIGKTGYSLARTAAKKVKDLTRSLTGIAQKQATTREDMAISLVERMEEVSKSAVWEKSKFGFKDNTVLKTLDKKVVIRQGRNVDHLHSILRRGLDVDMSDLISSKSKSDLKDKIADAFAAD